MTPTIDQKLGTRIKSLRRSGGLNLSELSTLLGVSYQQVQKYESGRCQISAARIWDIAQALGVEATAIYSTLTTEKQENACGLDSRRPVNAVRREASELVAEYCRLAPDVRTKFAQLAGSLSHQTGRSADVHAQT
jgi:transcriptional regulator with XRE-family HTH domain